MALVLCPNLAIDRTVLMERLRPGELQRVPPAREVAGGKGVNVLRALRSLGHPGSLLGFAAGHGGKLLSQWLEEEGLQAHLVPAAGSTRTTTALIEADGRITELLEERAAFSSPEVAEFLRVARELARPGGTILMCGSLPQAGPADLYARALRELRWLGENAVVDASGEALRLAVEARPAVIKVNAAELAALAGRPLGKAADLLRASADLLDLGISAVAVTLGARGALLVRPEGVLRAEVPAVKVINTVGCGDAFSAGLLVGLEQDLGWPLTLRLAAAAATACATSDLAGEVPADALEQVKPAVRVSPSGGWS